jgi:hypothetical protein
MPPGFFLSKKNAAGKDNFGERFFCGSFSRKMDSESIAEARLQKRSYFVSPA